jgi:hypothetical protein
VPCAASIITRIKPTQAQILIPIKPFFVNAGNFVTLEILCTPRARIPKQPARSKAFDPRASHGSYLRVVLVSCCCAWSLLSLALGGDWLLSMLTLTSAAGITHACLFCLSRA